MMKALYPYYKMFAPKIVANSIPKSGTNLLLKVFDNVGYLKRANTGVDFLMSLSEVKDILRRLRRGEYLYAHLFYTPEYQRFMEEFSVKHVLIVRDPRDVVVSHAFYVSRQPLVRLYQLYKSLESTRERILTSIRGVPDDFIEGQYGLDSIGERYRKYVPWLDDPQCLVVKFEDLIGSHGKGNDKNQLQAIQAVISHLGLKVRGKGLRLLINNLYDVNSPTFRKGQIGSWQDFLDADMLDMLAKDKTIYQLFGYEL